jgi:hypothetical protein
VYTPSGTISVTDGFTFIGEGRFWCAGFVIVFSSRRTVRGDVNDIKRSLREELAWIVGVEVPLGEVERWLCLAGKGREGDKDEGRVGQWRDDSLKVVKRELPAEMFV